ncbi:hypothetical protein BJX64DRAFT_295089 [Aspergillus heterothallicus]
MKLLTYLLLGIHATAALAALRPDATPDEVAAAEAECGSLGVMRIDPAELPEGVLLSDVRMCADHPLGRPSTPDAVGRFRRFLPSWPAQDIELIRDELDTQYTRQYSTLPLPGTSLKYPKAARDVNHWGRNLQAYCANFPKSDTLCIKTTYAVYTVKESDTCKNVAKGRPGYSTVQLRSYKPWIDGGCCNFNRTVGPQICLD